MKNLLIVILVLTACCCSLGFAQEGRSDALGACCYSDSRGCEDNVTLAYCDAMGGDFYEFASCASACPTGACCYDYSNYCEDNVTQSYCESFGGTFYGEGSTCADACPTGTCIYDYYCDDYTTQAYCELYGGYYWEEGSSCTAFPTGSCCYGSWCEQGVYEAYCSAMGGEFLRGSCDYVCTTGACCYWNGCDDDVTQEYCDVLGGNFHAGMYCDEVCQLGRCCYNDYTACLDGVTRDYCALFLGGTWTAGATCFEACETPCEAEPETAYFSTTAPRPWSECLYLCPNDSTWICVGPGLNASQVPVVDVQSGCFTPPPAPDGCNVECEPALWQMGSWYYNAANGTWCAFITVTPGTPAGCVCVTLEDILPVELTSFDAIPGDGEVALRWVTASESDNDHFDILRDGALVGRVNASNSATGHTYNWTDSRLTNGREYSYTLEAVSITGVHEALATESATPSMTSAAVTEYALHQNYPNPFNPSTDIVFDLAESGTVHLTVFSSLGRTVATLVDDEMAAGRHAVKFVAADLPSGVYFYRLEAGDFSATMKMVLMK